MKVLLVDDHAVLRQGLKSILEPEFPNMTALECGSGPDAVAWVQREECDLVILDLRLPGFDGMEALRAIRAVRPRLPILIVSMHDEDEFAVRALRLGASGYLTKDMAAEKLVEAVERILSGGKYVSVTLAGKLASALSRPSDGTPHDALSKRELQVLQLLALGKTVKEIGLELGLSIKTVSTYRTHILEKLGVHTNTDLVRYALKVGLLRHGSQTA
jgi:two-component system invasion response regulator UvrY